jgi:hypothetical protein
MSAKNQSPPVSVRPAALYSAPSHPPLIGYVWIGETLYSAASPPPFNEEVWVGETRPSLSALAAGLEAANPLAPSDHPRDL